MIEKYGEEKIENIIFDLGNVVLDINIPKTIQEFKKLNIKGLKDCDIHPLTIDVFLKLEVGMITDEEFITELRNKYNGINNASDKQIWDAWNALLNDWDEKRVDLIKKISEKYNIFLLSNTNHPHRIHFLDTFRTKFGYEFETIFQKCYYSDVLKCRKPEVEIYEAVINDCGIDPNKTLFIDDNAINFEGAKKVGLNCYHLTNGETILDIF